MSGTSAERGAEGCGGGGLLCFLQSCLSMLPGEPLPIYQGVRCGIQMAVCMYPEQLKDLEGHSLMGSL